MSLKFPSILLATLSVPAFAALESQPTFEVFPQEVNLSTVRDRQSIVVRVTEPNGVHRNVTTEATFTFADPAKAKVENGVVTPLADGETKLKVDWNGKSAEVAVKVTEAQVDPAVSFRRDVMPVMLKSGCNAGGKCTTAPAPVSKRFGWGDMGMCYGGVGRVVEGDGVGSDGVGSQGRVHAIFPVTPGQALRRPGCGCYFHEESIRIRGGATLAPAWGWAPHQSTDPSAHSQSPAFPAPSSTRRSGTGRSVPRGAP